MKKAGILMPVASLPDRHGCGSFGPEAYHFVDAAAEAGFSIWQILPMNPLGYGNSPYAPYSSYAIDDIFLSLDLLHEAGLCSKAPSFMKDSSFVDYDKVREMREPYLREAYSSFKPDLNYTNFAYQEWTKNYAIFRALLKKNNNLTWTEWPEEDRNILTAEEADLSAYQDEILYQIFLQYELYLQWKNLKQYANDHGIQIMGDIPFYVGLNSADCFASRRNFLLDKDGHPEFIAGVPPDYFSKTGQRWGNPIYDWEYMEKDKFSFWIERLSYTQRMFDIVRVDHFRAFDTYWKIPSSCPTAIDGEWVEAPGYKLFDTVFEMLPDIEIVAEDLGDLRPEVHVLRDHYDFRGMRVIQFSFNTKGMPEDKDHLAVYTGTHDNAPLYAWYKSLSEREQRAMRRWLNAHGYKKRHFNEKMIEYTLASNGDLVIIPMGDWLHLGDEGRINTPGTLGPQNWSWRMTTLAPFIKRSKEIRESIENSGRIAPEE